MRATSLGHAGILIETRAGSILCDPWFVPAFFGSWFVFPRNDQLPDELMAKVEQPDFLYISHLHGDHFDLRFLADHVDRAATVLLPDFPTGEMEAVYRSLGFSTFVPTRQDRPVDLGHGVEATIHVEASISDGPGGDSALTVDDGSVRVLDMNDCRVHDLDVLTARGPIDLHWLQFSGAIWYPMVYRLPADEMREAVRQKIDAQFFRAVRYVQAVGARAVVPSAGPPCFLDPELFRLNVIRGDELSIFADQTEFLRRLRDEGIETGHLTIPGTAYECSPGAVTVTHPMPDDEVERIFHEKGAYLRRYQADWSEWLAAERASWARPRTDLAAELADWWEPLLGSAPSLCRGVGAAVLLRAGDEDVLVDFPHARVRRYGGEPYEFSFDLPRDLVEMVVAERAVDWSNSLFLSCRFAAWRAGEFNEFVYDFFKSLSPERMARAEAEARRRLAPPPEVEEVELGGYVMERWCPHRQGDLALFGEVADGVLTCHLHGWQFDLESGACLTAANRRLRVRPAEPAAS